MDKIRSILIEDEKAAREALRNYITKYCPQIDIIDEATNAKEAIARIHQHKPDLIFLDVEMPFGNAFDVLEGCSDLLFETIFVTAFSAYSLKALNQSAAYYILKPVSIEELILAVTKVQQQLQQKKQFNRNQIIVDNFKEQKTGKQQIILPTLEGFEVIKLEHVLRLKGNGNFTDIHLIDGSKKMACRFLKHYEELLDYPFIRVHKSHIINCDFVTSYNKGGYITLSDQSEIEVSALYKEQFLRAFN